MDTTSYIAISPADNEINPCLACGACCAFYRASFYWMEADDQTLGGVPVGLTHDFNHFFRIMNGTDDTDPRCVALEGTIGINVACSIYPRRSTVCINFVPSYKNGTPNEHCDKARTRHNLPPLTPETWLPEHKPIQPAA